MRFAVVRRTDGLVLRTEEHQRWLTVQELEEANPDVEYIQTPDGFDPLKCHRREGDTFVEFKAAPTAHDVLAARTREFWNVTDGMAAGGRQHDPDWAAYVQQLRNITDDGKGGKDGSVEGMRKRFPVRPDGTDAIAHLRSRT